MDQKRVVEALEVVTDGLAAASRGLATASRGLGELASALATAETDRSDQERVVAELVRRLGDENRGLLREIAARFSEEDTFTLADISDLMGMPKGSVRARLMNIGRSLRSMDADLGVLFDVAWVENANRYQWDDDARQTLMYLLEVKSPPRGKAAVA